MSPSFIILSRIFLMTKKGAVYRHFWKTLKKKKVSTYALRKNYNISPSILSRMKHNGYITLRTIEDFCRILDCKVEDIVEYLPDKQQNETEKPQP
ncbi:MAG: helix-turn-helix transcriptional regulator [Oscillospiraceae bacterium]|nr:helix-turn-helix transcriptional regulator [Oscillospiraceae bacterium]